MTASDNNNIEKNVPKISVAWRITEAFSSLKLTLVAIVSLGVGVLWFYKADVSATAILSAPLLLLTINLVAAIITNQSFRKSVSLLVFHIALVAVVLLAAIGRLMYLKGEVEVTDGTPMNHELAGYEAGPFHIYKLDEVVFVNEGFTIEYNKGLVKAKTENRVRWKGDDGVERKKVIGDQNPLVLKGYRFYTTTNKGFAPVFTWFPKDGSMPIKGSAHLPSYPINDIKQGTGWDIKGYDVSVWVMLMLDEPVVEKSRYSVFHVPEKHHVLARIDGDTMKMAPGSRFETEGGVLLYNGLRAWMGYRIYGDWTLPWILSASIVALISVLWYFYDKFSMTSWMVSENKEEQVGA